MLWRSCWLKELSTCIRIQVQFIVYKDPLLSYYFVFQREIFSTGWIPDSQHVLECGMIHQIPNSLREVLNHLSWQHCCSARCSVLDLLSHISQLCELTSEGVKQAIILLHFCSIYSYTCHCWINVHSDTSRGQWHPVSISIGLSVFNRHCTCVRQALHPVLSNAHFLA